ncbi:hypothetical protein [Terrihabitans sp. B22-R8]|uniref:hypothetical protein n=1 Tax=Terrihabitans sp. B22-R8 TaxID=3425128 RepID=UPI00403D042B
MTAAFRAEDLIAGFESAAEQARGAEQAYRNEAARHIQALAAERVTAFRRLNLVRAVARAVTSQEDPQTAFAAARGAVRRELDWDSESPRKAEVLDALTPFFQALVVVQPAEGEGEAAPPDLDAAIARLRAFEDWYRDDTGVDFYALFDRYMPETPLVDF